jgi:hypothetical protein
MSALKHSAGGLLDLIVPFSEFSDRFSERPIFSNPFLPPYIKEAVKSNRTQAINDLRDSVPQGDEWLRMIIFETSEAAARWAARQKYPGISGSQGAPKDTKVTGREVAGSQKGDNRGQNWDLPRRSYGAV